MNRFVILNSLAFTRYPLTHDNGNVIPWWSLQELNSFLEDPATTLSGLSDYFLRAMITRLFSLGSSNNTLTAYNICVNKTMPCYIFLPIELRDHPKIKNFILMNEVNAYLKFRFVEQHDNKWHQNDITARRVILSEFAVTHQSNKEGVIKPFSIKNKDKDVVSFNVKTLTELPLLRLMPDDFYESKDHWAFNPYLYYDNTQQINIYRVSDGIYSGWVMAHDVNCVKNNPEWESAKDLCITLMSWDTVLDLPVSTLSDAVVRGAVFPVDIVKRGYRFIRLKNGRIYAVMDNMWVNISKVVHV